MFAACLPHDSAIAKARVDSSAGEVMTPIKRFLQRPDVVGSVLNSNERELL